MAGKGLPAAIQALLDDESVVVKYALEIDTSTPVRICTGAGPAIIDSDRYDPRGFEVSSIAISPGRTTSTIKIDDQEDLPGQSATLMELSYSERLTGKTAALYLTAYDIEAGAWEAAIGPLSGGITRCRGDGKGASVTIEIDESAGDRRRACLHVGSRNCTNVFGGARCGGAHGSYDTCDGSWASCTTRGRTIRFRGLRYALEAGTPLQIGPDKAVLQPPIIHRWRRPVRVSDVAPPPPVTVTDVAPTTLTEEPSPYTGTSKGPGAK